MEKNITFNIYQSDASAPVDLSFNYDFVPKKTQYKTMISENEFGDIIFEVNDKKTKEKSVNFGGRLYHLHRIIITKNIKYDSGQDTFVVIEVVDDYNDKLRIVLPSTEIGETEAVPNNMKELTQLFQTAKDDNKQKGQKKKININGLISPRLYSYYEDENAKYILYEESTIRLNTTKDNILRKGNLDYVQVSGDEIKISSSVGMNKALSDVQLFDDIYIDCAPIDNPSINNQIVKPKELYSIRPLFNTKDLGINSKFFIMLFISVIVCALCFYVVPNIMKQFPKAIQYIQMYIQTIMNGESTSSYNNASGDKNASNASNAINIFSYIILFGSFILATYQLSKRSFGTSYKKYKNNIDIASGIFGGFLILFYLKYFIDKLMFIMRISNYNEKRDKIIAFVINIAIPIGVIFLITYSVTRLLLPEMLVPKLTEVAYYSLFLYAIYFILNCMIKQGDSSEGGSRVNDPPSYENAKYM